MIIDGNVEIGSAATIYHRVTLGQSHPDSLKVSKLADNVYVGAGASIIGAVFVGDDAKVGAGAVVNRNVPAGQTPAGVPARAVVRSNANLQPLVGGTSNVQMKNF